MEIIEIIDLNKNIKQQMKKHRCSPKKNIYTYIARMRMERAIINIQNMKKEMNAQFNTAYIITQRKKGGKRATTRVEIGT